MNPWRVLVVDDSALVRSIVCDVLSGEPDLAVAGTASDGTAALEQLERLRPDALTLDIEMPGRDGLEVLKEIRKNHPRLPVIMLSTLTRPGAEATLQALALGAHDYVAKPAAAQDACAYLRELLVPKLRSLCSAEERRAALLAHPEPCPQVPAWPRVLRSSAARPAVLAIGVSTGGPQALGLLLPALPKPLPLAVLIVQHMPPVFTALLAERLAALSTAPVREAFDGAPVRPGEIWLAPGDRHLAVRGTCAAACLVTHQGPPENSCRPAVDVLFRSVAEVYGPRVLAAVLTGMGQDGLSGARAVKAAGGRIVVQDEASSVVWGMPGAVVRAGLEDAVVPLEQMAAQLERGLF